jgi:hypothetical protein
MEFADRSNVSYSEGLLQLMHSSLQMASYHNTDTANVDSVVSFKIRDIHFDRANI